MSQHAALGLLALAGTWLSFGEAARALSIAYDATPTSDGAIVVVDLMGEGDTVETGYGIFLSYDNGVGTASVAYHTATSLPIVQMPFCNDLGFAGVFDHGQCQGANGGVVTNPPPPHPIPDSTTTFVISGVEGGEVIHFSFLGSFVEGQNSSGTVFPADFQVVVPEPATAALLSLGLVVLAGAARPR